MARVEFINATIFYKKGRRRDDIIKDLNVCFLDGKINVILGSSGSGKSTLLKSIVDICDHEGKITIDNQDINDILINKRNVRYVSQSVSLYTHMTIFDNIAFPLKVQKLSRDEILSRTRNIAKKLGIEICLNQRSRYISLGQQQRAMLARELVCNPRILLLDEPFSNLEPKIREELCELVKELNQEFHITILFVTHSYKEAINLADHLFILDEGRIIANGAPKKLIDENNPYLEEMLKNDYIDMESIGEKEKEQKR